MPYDILNSLLKLSDIIHFYLIRKNNLKGSIAAETFEQTTKDTLRITFNTLIRY